MIITGLRFKMKIKDYERDLVNTLCILNLHPEKIIKPRRHDIQCHFSKKNHNHLMGILNDFPMSISEQAKLACVRLRSMKCSHGKKSPFLFSHLSIFLIILALYLFRNYCFLSLSLVFIFQ